MSSGKGSSAGAVQVSGKNVSVLELWMEPFEPYLTPDFGHARDSTVGSSTTSTKPY